MYAYINILRYSSDMIDAGMVYSSVAPFDTSKQPGGEFRSLYVGCFVWVFVCVCVCVCTMCVYVKTREIPRDREGV